MKKLTLKNIKHFKTRSKSVIRLKRKRKYKYYKAIENFKEKFVKWQSIVFEDIIVPIRFDLKYENCNDVIKFISDLKKLAESSIYIQVLMDDVEEIGIGAIAMLLSVINELGAKKISIKGTKPKNKTALSVLENSGFFKYLRTTLTETTPNNKNTFLKTGDNTTPSSEIAKEVRKAMETVWGVEARCPELYGGIMEMVRNTCDHAFIKNLDPITWHFGLSHLEDENKVKFSFVDNGKGIIKTFTDTLLKTLIQSFKDNADFLNTAFNNGIESRTGLSWRGKGLPTIFDMYTDKIITRFIVISNDVYIDFDNNIFVTLPISFSGTYYYWEIEQTCAKKYFI
jgi:hypothetical protein